MKTVGRVNIMSGSNLKNYTQKVRSVVAEGLHEICTNIACDEHVDGT